MQSIANLLFEASFLKKVPRAGFNYLGAGQENVAAHSFCATFIGFVMSRMDPSVNTERLLSMCLLHDLPEARYADHTPVHKRYVTIDQEAAVTDLTRDLPFGDDIQDLLAEFEAGETRESQLAYDADQLSFAIDLKGMSDLGYQRPEEWLEPVLGRLSTDIGRQLGEMIQTTAYDTWWRTGLSQPARK